MSVPLRYATGRPLPMGGTRGCLPWYPGAHQGPWTGRERAAGRRFFGAESGRERHGGRADDGRISLVYLADGGTPARPWPMVDIGQWLHDLYDQASYDLRIDYTGDPDPPLLSVDAAWADQLLRQQGLRVGVFWPYDLPLEEKGFSLRWRLFSVDNPSRASGSVCRLETRRAPISATPEQQCTTS